MKTMVALMVVAVSLVVVKTARPLAAQEPLPKHDGHSELPQFHAPSSEPTLIPAASSWLRNWLAQDYMFGNWGGLRTRLLELGVSCVWRCIREIQRSAPASAAGQTTC
jgi:hypothetical protein